MKRLIIIIVLLANVVYADADEVSFSRNHAGFVLGGLIYRDGKFGDDFLEKLDRGFYTQFFYKYSVSEYFRIKPFFAFSIAESEKRLGKEGDVSYRIQETMETSSFGALAELYLLINRVELSLALGFAYHMNKLKIDFHGEDNYNYYKLGKEEFRDSYLGLQIETGVEYKITDLFSLGGKLIYINNKFSKTHYELEFDVKLNAFVIGISGTFSF